MTRKPPGMDLKPLLLVLPLCCDGKE